MTKLDHYPMTKDDYKIISEDISYQNFFSVKSYKLQHRLFQGGWSNPVSREVFDRGPVAAVIPYDPVTDKVVLIEQFRVGCVKADKSPWLLEIIAGIKEDGESLEAMIIRELAEEGGIIADQLFKVYDYWVSPGGSTEHLTFYWAKIDATRVGGVKGVAEENEDILVHVFDAEVAFDKLSSGQINNAATIIGLQWLKIHREELHNKWR